MAIEIIDLGKEINYIDIDTAKVPYTFNIKLVDKTFTFVIKYNEQGGFFTADLYITSTGEILACGDPIRYGRPMFGSIEDERFPNPVIIPVCLTGDLVNLIENSDKSADLSNFQQVHYIDTVTFENFGKEVKLYLFDRRIA